MPEPAAGPSAHSAAVIGEKRRLVFALAMAAVVLLGFYLFLGSACGPRGCFAPAPTFDFFSPVVGVVIAVDSTGLNQVREFTLRTPGNFGVMSELTFKLGALDNPTDFPPGHLNEHRATSEPVRVYFRAENGERVVYRLEDARE